ncbi:hypothetical protein [Cysteiniphilum halobium]|uniref:hypothetical protein n=1 Tax=Cysteiniphilum halobium TaxID=2219059 RepID=UPI003F86122F
MYKCKYNQHGGVLLIALIIVAVVSILSGSILYMLKTSIVQNKAIENYNNSRNSAFLSLKDSLEVNDYVYSNTPVFSSVKNYSSGNSNVTVTSTVQSDLNEALFLDSIALNNASAVLQYHVTMQVSAQTQHQADYVAIVNAPSQYRQENDLTPQTTQNINIPTIILTNLNSAQQISGTGGLTDGQAGFWGTVDVDNSGTIETTGKEVVLSPASGSSYALKFEDNGTYKLEQGWHLDDGEWYWNLLLYDTSTVNAWHTSIALDALETTPSDFSSLTWQNVLGQENNPLPDYDSGKQYPKGSYITFDGQVFVSTSAINSGNNKDPYSNPNNWRLVIPGGTYPNWNTDVKYYKGDIITYNSVQYVAIRNNGINKGAPPNNGWAVAQFGANAWQSQVYNPGDMVTYNGFTFVNIRRSSANRNPFQQNGRWRVVPPDSLPLAYDSNVVYTLGLQISYDNQVFVNISSTSNNPYQNNNNRWRIVIPENTAPTYNNQVRYYKDDRVTYAGTQYIANVNYNGSIAPNSPPPGNNWQIAP